MKIFIFRPSKEWNYCGGGLVILASNLNACRELMGHEGETLLEKELEESLEFASNIWILVDVFEVDTEQEERVILYDYNWA